MKFISKTVTVIAAIALLSSCASIVSKSIWPLRITTDPSGAKVEVTDKKGELVYIGNTPSTMMLRSGSGFFGRQSYRVKLTLDGYGEKIIPVECTLNAWYCGNVIFGGLIGLLIVDPATGAMYRLDRQYINETLVKTSSSNAPSLRIINLNDVPENMMKHLVCIK